MFDLTAQSEEAAHRPLRERSLGPGATAILAHLVGVLALLAVPVSRAMIVQPETPTIQAFVTSPEWSAPVLPAPPPVPSPRSRSHAAIEPPAVPVESPNEVRRESGVASSTEAGAGEAGGIEGGAPGGVVGGVAGGIEGSVPVAALPARPLTRPVPLRTSGAIRPADLLHRVDPVYSPLAALSHVTGVVIVEAVVDVDGSVESVKVLSSTSPLLDKAATDAMKQWRYAPLVLADLPTRFVVTVTFNFRFPELHGTDRNDN